MKSCVSVPTNISKSKHMDLFIENPGLFLIGKKIFRYLDFNTKSTCRLVNKSWKILLEKRAANFNVSKLKELLTNSGKVRNESNQNNMLPLERRTDDKIWVELLDKLQSKLKSKWIYIYLQEFLQRRLKQLQDSESWFSSSPILEFTWVRNVKMIEFILQENAYNFLSFNLALREAAKRRDNNVLDCLLPYTFEIYDFNFQIRFNLLRLIMLKASLECTIAVDRLENNPIHIAASIGDKELVKYFLRHFEGGLKALTAENKNGQTPMFFAIVNNRIETVKFIAQNLSEQEIVNSKCGTLLKDTSIFHIATQHEHFEILKILRLKVSNLDIKDRNGNMPIHLAAKTGHFEIVKLLASRTTNLNIANNYEETPAKIARSNGHFKIERFLNRLSRKRKFVER